MRTKNAWTLTGVSVPSSTKAAASVSAAYQDGIIQCQQRRPKAL